MKKKVVLLEAGIGSARPWAEIPSGDAVLGDEGPLGCQPLGGCRIVV